MSSERERGLTKFSEDTRLSVLVSPSFHEGIAGAVPADLWRRRRFRGGGDGDPGRRQESEQSGDWGKDAMQRARQRMSRPT